MLCALILAGGKGTRFWPLSTEEKPKQFLKLIGNDTMLQMTVNRISSIIPMDRIFVCTGKSYVDLVREQLKNLPESNIIIEPDGRNTAPCIALSSLIIKRFYSNATMLVLPADHLIKKEDVFREIVLLGEKILSENQQLIMTLGIKPDRAETGYGYIKKSNIKDTINGFDVIKVGNFVEKPNKEVATEYLLKGSYLWNSGVFMWNINTIIQKIKLLLPDTYEALKFVEEISENKLQDEINKKYKNTDAISIDYGILEKVNEIYAIQSDIGWDDVGNWVALERYKKKDSDNNIKGGLSRAISSYHNIVMEGDKEVVLIGIDQTMVLETKERIYVINRDYIDKICEIREEYNI